MSKGRRYYFFPLSLPDIFLTYGSSKHDGHALFPPTAPPLPVSLVKVGKGCVVMLENWERVL